MFKNIRSVSRPPERMAPISVPVPLKFSSRISIENWEKYSLSIRIPKRITPEIFQLPSTLLRYYRFYTEHPFRSGRINLCFVNLSILFRHPYIGKYFQLAEEVTRYYFFISSCITNNVYFRNYSLT